jgi:D-glycero-D-manno-heptose 1,7-bisphosphate phosphatase
MRPAVFFDRDGVLNEDIGYVFKPSQLKWVKGAKRAVKAVNQAGYFAFVVTNQSGIARGFYTEANVQTLHKWISDELSKIGAHIDAFEYCPHHPDAVIERYRRVCDRRKPAPGMINDLLKRFPIDVSRSILIGDKTTDIKAAETAGVKGLLFDGDDLEMFVNSRLLSPLAESDGRC